MFRYNENNSVESAVGMIIMYGGGYNQTNQMIDGWLICDGAAYSRTNYSRLFNVIGTTYGAGDGSTTFNIPNLANKFIMGSSGINSVNVIGGSEKKYITSSEFPSHNHSSVTSSGIGTADHTHSMDVGWAYTVNTGGYDQVMGPRRGTGYDGTTYTTWKDVNHSHNYTTASIGKGVPISTLPPYLSMCFLIKY